MAVKKLPLVAYIPVEFLFDGDFKLRMSENTREIAETITLDMVYRLV